MTEIPLTRVCTKCGIEKPMEEFGRAKKGKFGRRARCKVCEREASAMWHAASNGPIPDVRPGCREPDMCRSKSARLCKWCSIVEVTSRPDVAAKVRLSASATLKRLHADPTFQTENTARASARLKEMARDEEIQTRRRNAAAAALREPKMRDHFARLGVSTIELRQPAMRDGLQRYLERRRLNEEFDAFMLRMEQEEREQQQPPQEQNNENQS